MSVGDQSRENEPSAFGWIFGGVVCAATVGAAVWAVVTGRRRDDPVVVAETPPARGD